MSIIERARMHTQSMVGLANESEKAAAEALMARKYAERGYGEGHRLPAGCDTIVAISDGILVGTLSLAVDGANGLPSDGVFRCELDHLRASGARLCELTRFVVDLPSPSMTMLSKLFAVIHDHGLRHYNCTDLIITADSRHRGFYRRKWGFECLGPAKINPASGAVSQLMRVRVAAIEASNDNLSATKPFRPGAISAARAARRGIHPPAPPLTASVAH